MKYKEEGKREASISLYSLMPQTLETQRARGLTDMLSEVGEPPPPDQALALNLPPGKHNGPSSP